MEWNLSCSPSITIYPRLEIRFRETSKHGEQHIHSPFSLMAPTPARRCHDSSLLLASPWTGRKKRKHLSVIAPVWNLQLNTLGSRLSGFGRMGKFLEDSTCTCMKVERHLLVVFSFPWSYNKNKPRGWAGKFPETSMDRGQSDHVFYRCLAHGQAANLKILGAIVNDSRSNNSPRWLWQ